MKKNVLVLYTGMSLMLCAHSLYCDMSQLIVLLAFGNVSGLSYKYLSFLSQFAAEFHFIIISGLSDEHFTVCYKDSSSNTGTLCKIEKNTPCSL